MTDTALDIYEKSRRQQLNHNEARRIRTRVTEARKSRHVASVRWPFELLQNALDAGPRADSAFVTVKVRRGPSSLVFEHDGAPFSSIELAALLSGGSSKEFESDVTTGRFGTGFLVTHVLAAQTHVSGLLEVEDAHEQFDLHLDRAGDEDSILANIESCNDAIRAATRVEGIEDLPSASFEYVIDDDDALLTGVESLIRSLPFLFATRSKLGRVELEIGDRPSEMWTAGEFIAEAEDESVSYRPLRLDRAGTATVEMRAYRFANGSQCAALVLVERAGDSWKLRFPEPDAPRVYREYPLRGSTFVPVNFVVDCKVEPDQERTKALMSETDRALLERGFAAAVAGIQFAASRKWQGFHRLAYAAKPVSGFDPTDSEELSWWFQRLARFAVDLAALPLVECTVGMLPASTEEGSYADFVLPRLSAESAHDETSIERLWPLVATCKELYPPLETLAPDWAHIASGWQSLGVSVNWISVKRVIEYATDKAKTLSELQVSGDTNEWLLKCLDVVGECWRKQDAVDVSVLANILPNQHKRLCVPRDLSQDANIPEVLKDLSKAVGHDVREHLLLSGLEEAAKKAALLYVVDALTRAVPAQRTEQDVIEAAVDRLEQLFPEDEECADSLRAVQQASVRLAAYLWDRQGNGAGGIVRRFPLLASTNRAVKWSRDRMLMAPVSSWPTQAQPFADAYPPARVLSELYSGNDPYREKNAAQASDGESKVQSIPNVAPHLAAWGIAFAGPLTVDTPTELKEKRLAAIAGGDSSGVVISSVQFSQIALLQPEVLNRCQENSDQARALLGLVLNYVVRHDDSWKKVRLVGGRRAGGDMEITVGGALWLADLRFRSWVPLEDHDGKVNKVVADATTLNTLLDPLWLEGNDSAVELLSKWFGFDELELRLIGTEPDPEKRRQLRNGLAKLVETAGADPAVYVSLVQAVELQRKRSLLVSRCQQFGHAVQDAIESSLKEHGLVVTVIDHGFDFEVSDDSDDLFRDASIRFELGPYLLEVKATTTGAPRLTPTQARTAANESARWVLCVVDLRKITDETLDGEWTAAMVEPLAKIVGGVGNRVQSTCLLVEAAKSEAVGIRNDAALRYEVPSHVWEAGISISQWVDVIRQQLPKMA